MAAIIKIENLYKVYSVGKEKVVALGGINLQIEKGQICCILGTSGSGKSTPAQSAGRSGKPAKGGADWRGEHLYLERRAAGKVSQKKWKALFSSPTTPLQSYSALENVAMPLMFRGIPKGLRNCRAKMILTGGTGQTDVPQAGADVGRSAAACGYCPRLCFKPKIVFADEPTGNLDTRTTKEVMELMVRLCRKNNQTLVLVTHDRELALYADRIITLIDGKVVDDRPNQSIAQAAAEEVQPQEQEEGAHDFVIPILGKEKQEENNTKTSTEQVANELLPDQLQKGSANGATDAAAAENRKGRWGVKMKQKKIVRAVCLFLAILMVVSVMGSVLVTSGVSGDRKKKEHRLYGASA